MESDLSRVVDSLPGLVWTALPDGDIDFFNQRWITYTGLGVTESCGRGWQTAVHPEDLPELIERWRSNLASGLPGEIEARLRRFDGTYRWFLLRASPLADASGQVIKWCGTNIDIDDRKRAEDSLRASEHRFRLIIDGIPALVTLRTPAGDLQFANRQVLEFFGVTLEDMKGRPGGSFIHPDDRTNALAAWDVSLGTGTPYDLEVRHRRVDGVYRWFHMRGYPLRNTDGHIVLWYLLHTDVHERKRTEGLLAGEKLLFEMIASARPLPAILDALCRLLDATAEGCSSSVLLHDYTGTRVQQVVGPGLPSSYGEALKGRLTSCDAGPSGMAATLGTQVIVSDVALDTRWNSQDWPALALAHGFKSCWSSPILSVTGEPLGTFSIYQRIAGGPTPFHQGLIQKLTHVASIAIDRARNEDALKRSEAILAEAQLLSATGSFSLNPATGSHWWSEQTYRIFGVDSGQQPTFEIMRERVHPDDLALLNHGLLCARRGESFSMEFRLQMPDGALKYLHVVAHAIGVATGEPFEFVGAVRDITDRRLSEEALAKVRSELAHVARVTTLGALTASIAHEVNQPLSGIITNASTCLRMLAADPPNVIGARETARRTIRDGHRAADVITRLRALFGKKGPTTESVDLNEAAREVIALSSSELQRSRVILRMELADDLPSITGDRVQIQQVILNLLLNASDAMSGVDDRPRQLAIRTDREEDDRVRLSVQDAGVGFEPQGLDRLFEAFYTTKSHGMGIGLSVSRSIIESHRGRLWAAPNDGPGATFSFSIPRGPDGATGSHNPGILRTPATTDAARALRST